jgi:hypothetical protein
MARDDGDDGSFDTMKEYNITIQTHGTDHLVCAKCEKLQTENQRLRRLVEEYSYTLHTFEQKEGTPFDICRWCGLGKNENHKHKMAIEVEAALGKEEE